MVKLRKQTICILITTQSEAVNNLVIHISTLRKTHYYTSAACTIIAQAADYDLNKVNSVQKVRLWALWYLYLIKYTIIKNLVEVYVCDLVVHEPWSYLLIIWSHGLFILMEI